MTFLGTYPNRRASRGKNSIVCKDGGEYVVVSSRVAVFWNCHEMAYVTPAMTSNFRERLLGRQDAVAIALVEPQQRQPRRGGQQRCCGAMMAFVDTSIDS